MRSGAAAAAALFLVASCTVPLPAPAPPAAHDRDAAGPPIRVALAISADDARLSATGAWDLYEADGRRTIRRGAANDALTIVPDGSGLRAISGTGLGTATLRSPLIARPAAPGTFVTWNGARYRGELAVYAADGRITAVNRLPLEDYLRGVVPLEIGDRLDSEREAVAAQAVAARSYAWIRIAGGRTERYDAVATVMNQVYGGVDAERPVADAAIARTAGLVLLYGGRVVNAPYHSTCGGTTAEAPEVWRSPGESYLRRVSDRVPGTDRYYCEGSPRFRWTRNIEAEELAAALERHLGAYAAVPAGPLGSVRTLEVEERTPSGRVGWLAIVMERGRFRVRGNDVRFVLRAPGGEILNSTYFSLSTAADSHGRLRRLTLRGSGYGHGVGMCQWGAIGRARAGQDFRTILSTYYPGTTVAPAP